MRTLITRTIAATALVAGALASPAPALAAGPPQVASWTYAGSAYAGPVDGQPDGWGWLPVEAWLFEQDGRPGTAFGADLEVNDMFCPTEVADVSVTRVSETQITAHGTVTGWCFDHETEQGATYTAIVDVTWTAKGRPTHGAHTLRSGGANCVLQHTTYDSSLSGSVRWSIPDLGLTGTALGNGRASFTDFTSRCPRS